MTVTDGGLRGENNPARSGTRESFVGRYMGPAGEPTSPGNYRQANVGGNIVPFAHSPSAVKTAYGENPMVKMNPHPDFSNTYEMHKAD